MLGVDRLFDPVDNGVPHVDIGRPHIDLGAQGVLALTEFAFFHAVEQIQVLFHGPVAIGAVFSLFREGSPVFPDFIRGQAAHVGLAVLD